MNNEKMVESLKMAGIEMTCDKYNKIVAAFMEWISFHLNGQTEPHEMIGDIYTRMIHSEAFGRIIIAQYIAFILDNAGILQSNNKAK